ncbi:hypothetical protein SDC9_84445 [bioreactor metagenome]|uniref:Uncharacterized protein n=1 Tax=bioreactor metagenome TaxID=1076179 RepID=A0A644ZAB2_9ZZZZ
MKKTLTVNLGGTVFHIDEDAYRLLDNYLMNLKHHFRKQEGAEEIVNDIENRISELFSEKISKGQQVITLIDAEEVIHRMGKPEDLSDEEPSKQEGSSEHGGYHHETYSQESGSPRRRLFRNPDDKVVGGVLGGIAAYLKVNVSALRLIVILLLIFGVGTLIPVYIVCWIVIPEATTAAEKLSMRGEEVNMENIGKTVTDGFEKMADGVNSYIKSEKPKDFMTRLVDGMVHLFSLLSKVFLVILALIFSPVLLVLSFVFVGLIIGAIATLAGGSAIIYELLPSLDWNMISASPLIVIVASIAGIILVGIPLASLLYGILRVIFNWQPMIPGLKITLLILWVVSLLTIILCFSRSNWVFPYYHDIWYVTGI